DLGGRAGVALEAEPLSLEAGALALRSIQRVSAQGPLPLGYTPDWLGDKAYAAVRWKPTGAISLRMLISHQIFSGDFGGLSGSICTATRATTAIARAA